VSSNTDSPDEILKALRKGEQEATSRLDAARKEAETLVQAASRTREDMLETARQEGMDGDRATKAGLEEELTQASGTAIDERREELESFATSKEELIPDIVIRTVERFTELVTRGS